MINLNRIVKEIEVHLQLPNGENITKKVRLYFLSSINEAYAKAKKEFPEALAMAHQITKY
jgi:hypothetical protein